MPHYYAIPSIIFYVNSTKPGQQKTEGPGRYDIYYYSMYLAI